MKKQLLILMLFFTSAVVSEACTTFVLEADSGLTFGKNLDWISDDGIIVVNQRNVEKQSLVFPPDESIMWVSKYGSITFNQFGKEMPFGGINETGLVVELMNAPAAYPRNDGRKAVNELQWIQYQLDNCSSIEEMIATDTLIRISAIEQQLHYLVCDSSGNVAVVEFINGERVIRTGGNLPYPVLENDLYSESIGLYEANVDCRFSKAVNMLDKYQGTNNKEELIDYSFEILDEVALDGSWSIVYDIENMRIYFKTASRKRMKLFDFANFDYNCTTQTKCFDLKSKAKGDISNYFEDFTSDINKKKMKSAFDKHRLVLPGSYFEALYECHKLVRCVTEKE
jgi:choloylglycine hydrolase